MSKVEKFIFQHIRDRVPGLICQTLIEPKFLHIWADKTFLPKVELPKFCSLPAEEQRRIVQESIMLGGEKKDQNTIFKMGFFPFLKQNGSQIKKRWGGGLQSTYNVKGSSALLSNKNFQPNSGAFRKGIL